MSAAAGPVNWRKIRKAVPVLALAVVMGASAPPGCQSGTTGSTAAVLSSANGNEQLANQMAAAAGWGTDEQQCLDDLWTRESGFRSDAVNPDSGATGIPQLNPHDYAIPADWGDPAVQIRWGLAYIRHTPYGTSTPCGAWGHEEAAGWY
jgi:resuscitation-promoting factor RpfB